jgi:predicted secreted protein
LSWFSGFVVYVVIWWIVFFMALPWGVKAPHEVGEEPAPGHTASAPVRPLLWRKAAIVTVISAVLWGVVYYVNVNDLISFTRG